MAETIQVYLNFDSNFIARLQIPERVVVQQKTMVHWQLITIGFGYHNSILEVQLYFSNESPFYWHTQSIAVSQNQGLIQPRQLAQGIAEQEGDYKYGIKVIDRNEQKILCDDDPYLIVRNHNLRR